MAYLSNRGSYTLFTFRERTIKFLTSKNLEKYTSIVEWDNGYLVVLHLFVDEMMMGNIYH